MTLHLDLDELSARERYKLLTALIIPRPIAWVTTINSEGQVNAAPYSFFNVFGQFWERTRYPPKATFRMILVRKRSSKQWQH